jgi:hypothetical protein
MRSCNFLGPNSEGHRQGRTDSSEPDLDACYHIMYHASRLTRWPEAPFDLSFRLLHEYWDRLDAQISIKLNETENPSSQEDRTGVLQNSADELAAHSPDEQGFGRGFWTLVVRAWVHGRQGARPVASAARMLLEPVCVVTARSLIFLGDVARVSLRMGNSRAGRPEDYGDDGENPSSENFSD